MNLIGGTLAKPSREHNRARAGSAEAPTAGLRCTKPSGFLALAPWSNPSHAALSGPVHPLFLP
jgi:hypothetical protein